MDTDKRKITESKECPIKLNGLCLSPEDKKPVARPWGTYTVICDAGKYKIKVIEMIPGKRLSLQFHEKRSEHWIVVAGEADIEIEEHKINLLPGQSVYVPAGKKHRLRNNQSEVLKIVEVQFGDYVGEDDIVRLEDDFNRLGKEDI